MATVVITEWQDDASWVGESAWNLDAFCDRLQRCTPLRGTELKRVARGLKKREIARLEEVDIERANPLFHLLESLGAKYRAE